MKPKKTILKIIILAVILGAAVTTGFLCGLFRGEQFALAGKNMAATLLKLITMAAGVITGEALLVMLLSFIKPKQHRMRSILTLSISALKYIAGILIFCWGLGILGVNIGTILASLGVLALIIGFAADSLIADIVTGIFMLFENQYNVGDIIELGGFRGTVSNIGIRTTSITDASNNIKIINNADMRNLLNRSDNISKSISDIGIPYETDLEALEEKLPELLDGIYGRNQEVMLAAPVYLGVQQLADSAIILRFCVDVKEQNIYSTQRVLNRELFLTFRKQGTECPFTQIDIHRK